MKDDDFTKIHTAVTEYYATYDSWQKDSRGGMFTEALGKLTDVYKQFSRQLDGLELKTARGQYARCMLQELLAGDVQATELRMQDQRFVHSTMAEVYQRGGTNEQYMAAFVRSVTNDVVQKTERLDEPTAAHKLNTECKTHPVLAAAHVQTDALMALTPTPVSGSDGVPLRRR